MISELVRGIRDEIDTIDARYRTHFLNRWRGAHDPSMLAELLTRTRGIVTRIDQFPPQVRGPELASFLVGAQQRIQAFQNEETAIDRFQRMSLEDREFGAFVHAARLLAARTSRHFAEHERHCDLALLDEIRTDLTRLHEMMTASHAARKDTAPDPDVVGVASLLAQLRFAIETTREKRDRATIAERAKGVAAQAKVQLELLAVTLANKVPLTRRPALVARIAASLRHLAQESHVLEATGAALAEVSSEMLAQRARVCEVELEQIRRLRIATPLPELVAALEEAAELVFEDYTRAWTGHGRASVDTIQLSRLCDELHELQRQLVDLSRVCALPENYERLWVTSKRLMLVESEYAAVVRARAPRILPLIERSPEMQRRAAPPRSDAAIQPDEAIGDAILLPLQQRILALPTAHHWSVPLVCDVAPEVSRDQIETIFRALLAHHDALRARFTRDADGTWRQTIDPVDAPRGVLSFLCDVSALPPESMDRAISGVMGRLAGEDSLARGGLCRLVLFERGCDQKRLLVLLTHHLVVDFVSLSILHQDMLRAHAQLSRGEPIALRRKTTSLKTWANALAELGQGAALDREAPRWRREIEEVQPPFGNEDQKESHGAPSQSEVVLLDHAQTSVLLRDAPSRYGVPIDTIVAASFARALARWNGTETAAFTWIHNGRSALSPGVNLRRTVGALYNEAPICTRIDPSASPAHIASSFVEQCGDFAARAMEYGALAFFGRDAELRAKLQQHPSLQIRVNYAGHPGRLFGATGDAAFEMHRDAWRAPVVSEGCRFPWRLYARVCVTNGHFAAVLDGFGIAPSVTRRLGELWAESLAAFAS